MGKWFKAKSDTSYNYPVMEEWEEHKKLVWMSSEERARYLAKKKEESAKTFRKPTWDEIWS